MTIEQAAHEIWEKHHNNKWFQCVGIGAVDGVPTLYIYTALKKYPKDYMDYGGHPVLYKYMGKIAPLCGEM